MKIKSIALVLIAVVTALSLCACSQIGKIVQTPTPEPVVTGEATPTPTAVPTIDSIELDSDYIAGILNKADKLESLAIGAEYSNDGSTKTVNYYRLAGREKITLAEGETTVTILNSADGMFTYDTKDLSLRETHTFTNPAYEKINQQMAKTATFYYQSQKRVNDRNCLEFSWIDENGNKMHALVSEADGIIMRVYCDSDEFVYNYRVTTVATEGLEEAVFTIPEEVTRG